MAVLAVLSIISAIASIATSAVQAGMEGAAADAATVEGRRRLAEEEKRRKLAETQDTRESNLSMLDRQRSKRAGAEVTARQVPGSRSIERDFATRTPIVDVSETPPPSRGITPGQGDAIAGGAKIAGDVATGVLGAVGAAAGQRAKEEEQAGIDKLEGDAFERALAKRKRSVNVKGLDFQEANLAIPASNAVQKSSFSTDFMKALREQSGRFQLGKVA